MRLSTAESVMSGNTSAKSIAVPTWWQDYFALTKPRITLMVLLTVAVAMVFAQRLFHSELSIALWVCTLVGTGFVAGSASVLNQWFERDRDSMMPRTARRPLPSGRLTMMEAAIFGWALVTVGMLTLWFGANPMSALVSFATWFIYCWVYTPMKTLTWWNTAVGTLPGALPVLIGWTAAGGAMTDWYGWALTFIVVLWQFPHFMSIAWLYREQYTQAGFKMLTRAEPTGIAAAWHAIIPSILLIPLSIYVIAPVSIAAWCVAIASALIAVLLTVASIRFLHCRSDERARYLLRTSLIYLPTIMLLVVVRWVML